MYPYRVRKKRKLEKDPQSLDEISLTDDLKVTRDDRQFLMKESEVLGTSHKILLFTTQYNIRKLCESKFWLYDGTFAVTPRIFYQLFTIHGYVGYETNGTCVPLVYALLSGKSEAVYHQLFKDLMTIIQEQNVEIMAQWIISDFELAPAKAIKCFLDVEIAGCWFHFKQAVMRNMPTPLKNEYDKNLLFNVKIKQLCALAYLDPKIIQDEFIKLKPDLDGFKLDGMDKFLTYFQHTWVGIKGDKIIKQIQIKPLFSPTMWSVYERTLLGIPRTTNHVESWHQKFNVLVGRKHISLREIIEQFKMEETMISGKINILEAGRSLTTVNKDSIEKSDCIYRIVSESKADAQSILKSLTANL